MNWRGITYDVQVIPHGHSTQSNIQISALQSPIHTPYQEYLWKWNEVNQFFFKDPLLPRHGMVHVPEQPGICGELDETKIRHEEEL